MSSSGKAKMKNMASFIKENVNIVQNSIIGMILLILEKLMDLEFKCPEKRILAIVYSLVFLIAPTIIVAVVACYYNPQGMCSRKRENSTEIEGRIEECGRLLNVWTNVPLQNLQTSATETKTKTTKGGWFSESIKSHWFEMKVVGAWILIVIADGRYWACLLTNVSIQIHNSSISSTEPPKESKDRMTYYTHLFQIGGLILILLAVIVVIVFESKIYPILASLGWKPESESEKYRKVNEDHLLQVTEELLQEEAEKKQKAFVANLLNREDWATYNPGSPNALEELGKITTKWKEEVKRQLENSRAQPE